MLRPRGARAHVPRRARRSSARTGHARRSSARTGRARRRRRRRRCCGCAACRGRRRCGRGGEQIRVRRTGGGGSRRGARIRAPTSHGQGSPPRCSAAPPLRPSRRRRRQRSQARTRGGRAAEPPRGRPLGHWRTRLGRQRCGRAAEPPRAAAVQAKTGPSVECRRPGRRTAAGRPQPQGGDRVPPRRPLPAARGPAAARRSGGAAAALHKSGAYGPHAWAGLAAEAGPAPGGPAAEAGPAACCPRIRTRTIGRC